MNTVQTESLGSRDELTAISFYAQLKQAKRYSAMV